jgi:hypothetical protein
LGPPTVGSYGSTYASSPLPDDLESSSYSTRLRADTERVGANCVEPHFGEAKEWHGARRFRLRGLEKVNAEALMIASEQNAKRLLSFAGKGQRRPAQVATLRRPEAGRPVFHEAVREHRERHVRLHRYFFNMLPLPRTRVNKQALEKNTPGGVIVTTAMSDAGAVLGAEEVAGLQIGRSVSVMGGVSLL